MASAIFNQQSTYCYDNPGSETNEGHTTSPNYDELWQPNEFNWSDVEFPDPDSIDFDWMWPALGEAVMEQIAAYISTPDANMGSGFLADSTQTPFQSPSTTFSSPGALLLTPSLTASYLLSPYLPLRSAPPPAPTPATFFSSPPLEPSKGYTCTICHPTRSYSTLPYLK
jgi:hypothetical protein